MNVYLDNAATTQILPEVAEAMSKYMIENYGNPSGIYTLGVKAKNTVDEARKIIGKTINSDPTQIYFTSGGTEGDNWVIKGVAEKMQNKGHHIVTSSIEHKAILKSCEYLSHHGFEITYVDPDDRGYIHVSDIEKAIRDDTILVSIMFANNEIGTIQPIRQIADLCKRHHVLFHTDAVQAYCHTPIDVKNLGVDFLTTSAHKFHGPDGIGFIYIKDINTISPFIHGGQQENGMRAGTENVVGIIGMSKAAEIANKNLQKNIMEMISLRDGFIDECLNGITGCTLNGSLISRLCNNISLTFDGVPGESAITMLDMMGISCSTGSACNSSDAKPSHVLTAIGHTEEYARNTLRFTLSELTTVDEINYTIDNLKRVVADLRRLYG